MEGDDDVEEWVLRAIQTGLMEAKMDQMQRVVVVRRCTNRVFGPVQWKVQYSVGRHTIHRSFYSDSHHSMHPSSVRTTDAFLILLDVDTYSVVAGCIQQRQLLILIAEVPVNKTYRGNNLFVCVRMD